MDFKSDRRTRAHRRQSYRDYMESENWETYFHECDEKHEYPLRWVQGLCELGFDQHHAP